MPERKDILNFYRNLTEESKENTDESDLSAKLEKLPIEIYSVQKYINGSDSVKRQGSSNPELSNKIEKENTKKHTNSSREFSSNPELFGKFREILSNSKSLTGLRNASKEDLSDAFSFLSESALSTNAAKGTTHNLDLDSHLLEEQEKNRDLIFETGYRLVITEDDILECFEHLNITGSKCLSADELVVAYASFNFEITRDEAEEVIKAFNTENCGGITQKDFCMDMVEVMSEATTLEHIQMAFNAMDHDHDGYIGFNDLKKQFVKLGVSTFDNDIYEMITGVQNDGYGRLHFTHFQCICVELMQKSRAMALPLSSTDSSIIEMD